jgi:hypothetical protein
MAAIETVLHAMLTRSRAKLYMASVTGSTISTYLHAKGRVVTEDGGPQITNPLIVGRNPNITEMEYYDQLPVAQTSEFTTVEYAQTRVVGTVIISEQEEDENKGRAAIFKILDGKVKVLDQSLKEQFATYHTGVGTGLAPNGLGNLVPDDPTSGIVGGINLATESQWRSSAYNFAGGLNAENIEEAFDDLLEIDLNRDKERPSVIFAGRDIYRLHKAAARGKQQISLDSTGTGKKLVNLGIVGTTHNGIPVLFDEYLARSTCYFINDKYLTLHVLAGVNMKVKKLVAPWTMDAMGRRVIWQGQLCTWRQHRTHAVLLNTA